MEEDSQGNALNVLANDSDPDSQPLSVIEVSAGSQGGGLTIGPEGAHIVYTPKKDFVGSENFHYVIRDSAGYSSQTAQVTVQVLAVNDAPVAKDDVFQIAEDSGKPHPFDLAANNGFGDDYDVDQDSLTILLLGAPDKGGTVEKLANSPMGCAIQPTD